MDVCKLPQQTHLQQAAVVRLRIFLHSILLNVGFDLDFFHPKERRLLRGTDLHRIHQLGGSVHCFYLPFGSVQDVLHLLIDT